MVHAGEEHGDVRSLGSHRQDAGGEHAGALGIVLLQRFTQLELGRPFLRPIGQSELLAPLAPTVPPARAPTMVPTVSLSPP